MNAKSKSAALAAAILAMGLALPASAHHSHAMFDDSKVVRLTGTVERISFNNPHAYLFVMVDEVEGTDGEFAEGELEANAGTAWAIEMSHVTNMIARGVRPNTIQEGHAIVIEVNPLRDGRPSGNYTRFVSLDGVENTHEGNQWRPAE